jgi:hypothetical protein
MGERVGIRVGLGVRARMAALKLKLRPTILTETPDLKLCSFDGLAERVLVGLVGLIGHVGVHMSVLTHYSTSWEFIVLSLLPMVPTSVLLSPAGLGSASTKLQPWLFPVVGTEHFRPWLHPVEVIITGLTTPRGGLRSALNPSLLKLTGKL